MIGINNTTFDLALAAPFDAFKKGDTLSSRYGYELIIHKIDAYAYPNSLLRVQKIEDLEVEIRHFRFLTTNNLI